MSMELRINNGSMKITDNNETFVSSDIAKEIMDNYQTPDNEKEDCNKPDLKITSIKD